VDVGDIVRAPKDSRPVLNDIVGGDYACHRSSQIVATVEYYVVDIVRAQGVAR